MVFGAVPEVQRLRLSNGIRVVVLHVSGSENVSIFTYLPMGLVTDGPGQAQWSHLIEHLVIRSTIPAGSTEANAETLPDHMRLDFYGDLNNWREGLSHHARWLEGVRFTEDMLIAEKPKAIAECDFAIRNVATHKFALAAWAQGYRHGCTRAVLKGDVNRATLAELQRHRDANLVVLDRVVMCVIGGVDLETIRTELESRLGKVTSNAQPAKPGKPHTGDRGMTWDLDARHLVIMWPAPDARSGDYPALLTAGRWLMMRCATDPRLKKMTGMVLAGVDLRIPEGDIFYVSASVRPEASFDQVRRAIDRHVGVLREATATLPEVSMLSQQLSRSLATPMDPGTIRAQAPPNVSPAMIEGNIGLRWGMQEFRYGVFRARLAKRLATVTADRVHRAAGKYLGDDSCSVVTIRPASKKSR